MSVDPRYPSVECHTVEPYAGAMRLHINGEPQIKRGYKCRVCGEVYSKSSAGWPDEDGFICSGCVNDDDAGYDRVES